MSARETAELLLQVGRLVQAEGYDGELSPAQWMALRFFARANPFSRTPSAFAEFRATTRGTATQAIKALEAGGYLVRQPFKMDGRSVSLRLTSKGKKALARDPFEVLVRAVICSTRPSELLCVARCTECCPLSLRVVRIGGSVFARTARTSAERRAAIYRAWAPRPLNACSSAFRFSQRT